jgi:hypothetical protein
MATGRTAFAGMQGNSRLILEAANGAARVIHFHSSNRAEIMTVRNI